VSGKRTLVLFAVLVVGVIAALIFEPMYVTAHHKAELKRAAAHAGMCAMADPAWPYRDLSNRAEVESAREIWRTECGHPNDLR
jgi:hypothetical protein